MRTSMIVVLLLLLFGPPRLAATQDSLAAARTLYQSAAYEEALGLLNRLRSSPAQATDAQSVGQYRAYCLLALNRQAEADRAIEEVVAVNPLFVPSDTDVSPRVRGAFQTVRRRMLPAIVQQKYTAAKVTFDRKDYAAAVDQFTRLTALLQDSALEQAPALSDLRVLAMGFLELAQTAAAAAPAPPRPDPVASPPAAAQPRVYDVSEPGVILPVTRRQDLPRWPYSPLAQGGLPERRGVLDVLIDENGQVENVMVLQSVDQRYDELLMAAARAWRYTPAYKDGRPVKFLKRIQVIVQ